MSQSNRLLSERNVRILFDICSYQLLTTDQVQKLHFSHLAPSSQAARVLLHRLRKAGLLHTTQTAARSTQAGDGLAVTKPIPVWYFPRESQRALQDALRQLGREDEFQPFERHLKHYNSQKSFSDLSLAHEIGLSAILIAFDEALREREDIVDGFLLRTSPRNPLVSAKVCSPYQGNSRPDTINPDGLLFFRLVHEGKRYPFFFFLEYERGTANEKKYLKEKVQPYIHYAAADSKCDNSFADMVRQLDAIHDLALSDQSKYTFRVLTVSSKSAHSDKLAGVCCRLNNNRRFLFSTLAEVEAGALSVVWKRAQANGDTATTSIP